MTSPRLAEIREVEQAEAATDMGVKEVIYLRHGDGDLEDNKEFREQVVRAIRQHRPQVVFTTDPFRRGFYLHRDHRVCGQVTIDATYPYARDHLHFPEHKAEGLETHKVADIMLWGTEEPDTFIDITDTIERKISSLKKHASQVSSDDGDVGDFIKSNGQRVGQRANFPYGEAFRRIQIRN
jgi:LmbE family N-acetylglucosaminyl deacetylase